MKAAVLEGLNDLVVREWPTPDVDDDSVLVKVRACAVCGSDIRMYRHGNPRLTPPAIMGHEASGEIVAVGKNVEKFVEGDRVALGGDVPCGECIYCMSDLGNNCPVNYALGYQFSGSFAEYVLLNALVVEHGPVSIMPDHVSFEEAALAEPIACVLNALEVSPVSLDDTVVVVGAGPIGCMVMEVAKQLGASKVIAVQRSKQRLDMARTAGADVCVCTAEEDAIERVLEETAGLGAHVVITACSSPQAQVDALSMARNRGWINFFGGLPKDRSHVALDTNLIHYKELFVTGSHGAPPRHHKMAVELIGDGMVDVKKYISHRFSLDEAPQAFAAAEGRDGMRVVIAP